MHHSVVRWIHYDGVEKELVLDSIAQNLAAQRLPAALLVAMRKEGDRGFEIVTETDEADLERLLLGS